MAQQRGLGHFSRGGWTAGGHRRAAVPFNVSKSCRGTCRSDSSEAHHFSGCTQESKITFALPSPSGHSGPGTSWNIAAAK